MRGVMQVRFRSAYELKLLRVRDVCLWSAESQGCSNFLFVVGYCYSMYRSCRLPSAVSVSFFTGRSAVSVSSSVSLPVWFASVLIFLPWLSLCLCLKCLVLTGRHFIQRNFPTVVHTLTSERRAHWNMSSMPLSDVQSFTLIWLQFNLLVSCLNKHPRCFYIKVQTTVLLGWI